MMFARYKTRILLTSGLVVILGLAGAGLFRYRADRKQKQPDSMVAEVSSLMVLPQETPTVARVVDPETVRREGPAFYANAQKDDVVLIFPSAQKAVLYRPSIHKIIEVMALTASSVSPTPAPAAASPYKFLLLNGTSTTGLTVVYEKKLTKEIPGAVVADRDNAKFRSYDTSRLISVDAAQADAKKFAETLHLTLDSLPAGEATPPAGINFIIILGSDTR